MVYSQFVSDAELNEYINSSAQELYDLLVECNVDYNVTTQAFTLSSGNSTYTLPVDFYKLRSLDFNQSGAYVPIWPYQHLERGQWQDAAISRLSATVQYRIYGGIVEFLPEDQAAGDFRLRYVPLMTELNDDADTFNGYNGFEEYIVIDAAIKCKDKEESSVSVLQDQKTKMTKRIQALAPVRDYGSGDRVQDVRGVNVRLDYL